MERPEGQHALPDDEDAEGRHILGSDLYLDHLPGMHETSHAPPRVINGAFGVDRDARNQECTDRCGGVLRTYGDTTHTCHPHGMLYDGT